MIAYDSVCYSLIHRVRSLPSPTLQPPTWGCITFFVQPIWLFSNPTPYLKHRASELSTSPLDHTWSWLLASRRGRAIYNSRTSKQEERVNSLVYLVNHGDRLCGVSSLVARTLLPEVHYIFLLIVPCVSGEVTAWNKLLYPSYKRQNWNKLYSVMVAKWVWSFKNRTYFEEHGK